VKTSNVQRPTSNTQWKKKDRSKRRSGGLQTADSLNGDFKSPLLEARGGITRFLFSRGIEAD
jgi:hypothetical protein